MDGVESKGVPGMLGSTWSAAATECEASRATTSSGLKPASLNRARIEETVSSGREYEDVSQQVHITAENGSYQTGREPSRQEKER